MSDHEVEHRAKLVAAGMPVPFAAMVTGCDAGVATGALFDDGGQLGGADRSSDHADGGERRGCAGKDVTLWEILVSADVHAATGGWRYAMVQIAS